ncbi:hypothetical protein NMG60_11036305 [Bertholletia excelsa]
MVNHTLFYFFGHTVLRTSHQPRKGTNGQTKSQSYFTSVTDDGRQAPVTNTSQPPIRQSSKVKQGNKIDSASPNALKRSNAVLPCGDSGREQNHISPLHGIIFFLIATMGSLLQSKQSSAFETHYIIMKAFVVMLILYAITLAAEIITQTRFTSFQEISRHVSLLAGAIASILLLVVLVPSLGWFLQLCWFIIFVRIMIESRGQLSQLFLQAQLAALQMLGMRHTWRTQRQRLPV